MLTTNAMISDTVLALSIEAERLPFGTWLTNSIFVAVLVTLLILFFASKATAKMRLIPHPAQNAFEFVVETLYNQLEGIVGPKLAPRAFPLLATIFIFILFSNWFGLVPGVGTVGWGEWTGPLSVKEVTTPLLRPPTADLNMTLGIAAVFMVVWLWITISEIGVWGFVKHTFGPKGGTKGVMGVFVAIVFLIVGMIEVVSIAFRPVSLSLRLFGNLYAGETLLQTMISLGETLGLPKVISAIGSVLFPLPFYFLELLIGLLQAVVFSLLCAVYIQLAAAHDDEHH